MPTDTPAPVAPYDPHDRYIETLERLLAIEAGTVHEALDQASDLLAEILATDKIDAFLYEPDHNALVALGVSDTSMGRHEREVGLDRLPVAGGGRHVEVFRTGRPYHTGRLDRDAGEIAGFARDLGVRSVVSVPVDVAGKRRGVVGAMAARPDAFSTEDAQFMAAVARWVGLVVARAEAEEARRAAEERASLSAAQLSSVQSVLEQMPVGVAVAAVPSGKLLVHNVAATRMLGHPLLESGDYNGYAQYGALHHDGQPYRPEEYPIARAVLHGETVVSEEMRYRRGDGTVTTFAVSAAPIHDATGAIVAAVSTFEDIATRKRIKGERDEVLRMVTHDLRSPLTSMRARAQLVQRRAGRGNVDPDWLRTQMDEVCGGTGRMLAIIDELNDVARLEEGAELDLKREMVDMGALARAAAEEVGLQRPASPVRVDAPATPVLVEGDRARLERVLHNVLGNAVKYSAPAAPITVTVTEAGPEVIVAVRDEGVGIPAEDLPHLFTRYYRASTARGIPGSGLGLAGAKAIVERHGGSIAVGSVVGRGATVTITLPRRATQP